MPEIKTTVQKAKEKLRIIVFAGLSMPFAWGIYDLIDKGRDGGGPALAAIVIGGIVGYFMIKGRKWAQGLWAILGFLLSVLYLILSLVRTSNSSDWLWILILLSCIATLCLSFFALFDKDIQIYMPLKKPLSTTLKMERLIEEIGDNSLIEK